MSKARSIVSGLVVLLLFLPASATVPTAQWNVRLVQRLRDLKRISPDAELDLNFRKLWPFLPVQGAVGFQNIGPPDDLRLFYRAQYALVPRQVLRTPNAEFVVEVGPQDSARSLFRDQRFSLVASPDEDLRLFRRIQ